MNQCAFIEWQGTFYIFYGVPSGHSTGTGYVYSYSPAGTVTLITTLPNALFYGASKTGCSP